MCFQSLSSVLGKKTPLVRHAQRVLKILEDITYPEDTDDLSMSKSFNVNALLLRVSPTASAWTVTMMGFLYLQSRTSFGGSRVEKT